jgi:hypothetical protein
MNWIKRHKVWSGIIGLIILGSIVSAAGGGKTSMTNTPSNNTTATKTEQKAPENKQPAVPAEYKSALAKAKQYSDVMHMSKSGIYDQLTSAAGEKFAPEAAQYAVDNLQTDYNRNALAKAKQYRDTMNMSPVAIHDQLTSAAGEKFTAAEADYAIQHLND